MPKNENANRLLLITTAPFALWAYFRPQIRFLVEHGFEVHAATSPGALFQECKSKLGVPVYAVPMARRISPLADLVSIARLWRLIRKLRPTIVHAHTPKAGLIGSIAAALAGVDTRIYTIHGLPLVTRTGWRRWILAMAERTTCLAARYVLCVGPSLRDTVAQLGICRPEHLRVLGHGSCSGIDLNRFSPLSPAIQDRKTTLGIFDCPDDGPVISFVGRFVHDKGLADLAKAWTVLRGQFPSARLLLCGGFEAQDPLDPATLHLLKTDPRVHFSPAFIEDTPSVYAASTVCVLPTFREGLGHVALESAAMQKPIVATRIPGCVDSVQDGVTGLLVEPHDPEALAGAIRRLLEDEALREQMGREGRLFVAARFSQESVSRLILAEYRRLTILKPGSPAPSAPLRAPRQDLASHSADRI